MIVSAGTMPSDVYQLVLNEVLQPGEYFIVWNGVGRSCRFVGSDVWRWSVQVCF